MQLSSKQSTFLAAAMQGQNIFLTGKAGTGKTFIVKELIKILTEQGRKVVAVAPTGVAANNIGGQTIHSLFALSPYGVLRYEDCNHLRTEKRRLLKNIDTFLIDEVSMLRPDILDAMNWTLNKNGCRPLHQRQVIFIGDLKQLPAPINDNTRSVLYQTYEGEEFTHAKVYSMLNVREIELDEVLRQTNEEFVNHLNLVRDGIKSEYFRRFVGTDLKGVVLAPHNATVQRYNIDGLNKLGGEELVFEAKVQGNAKADDFNLESIIRVKDGAKIMYLVNSKDNPLVNGTLGEFVVKGSNYFIKVGNVEYALERITATKKDYVYNSEKDILEMVEIGSIEQYPIKLAYALSIHKSQGLTFDEVSVDLSRPCFQKGQMYVALSRVKSPEGLRIIV
jgi:ATP-dependent DNA helicase PIF1